eukprot:14695176-Heterocapsa_arctica.AAC.1
MATSPPRSRRRAALPGHMMKVPEALLEIPAQPRVPLQPGGGPLPPRSLLQLSRPRAPGGPLRLKRSPTPRASSRPRTTPAARPRPHR